MKRQKSPLALVCPDSVDNTCTRGTYVMGGGEPHLTELIRILITEKKTYSSPDIVAVAADTVSGGQFEHRGKVSSLAQGAHINFDPLLSCHNIKIATDTAL